MVKSWEARSVNSPKLITAALFLFTALSTGSAFLKMPDGFPISIMSSWDHAAAIVAGASPLMFLCACVLVFFRPRFGYYLGLAAGLIAIPWFVRTELALDPLNSWVYLNFQGTMDSEVVAFLRFIGLRISSSALIVIAVACASLRLLPARWSLRQSPLCHRTWPAFAVGFLVMAVWFAYSVTPYSAPGQGGGMTPEFRILHVQKYGLHFHETKLSAAKDGRVYILRNDRRLFQYRFEGRGAVTALGETSPTALQQARTFVQSPELWKLQTPPPRALRSWNAEGWYVVLKDSRLLAFTSEYRTTPPKEVTDLFYEIEKLPASSIWPFPVRDVCLGFCYDPVAGLGFSTLK
jgi:hypothetical protein